MAKTKKGKKQEKQKVIKDFQTNEQDTGSTEVQIGLLTKEIKELTRHLATHIHDHSSRRGLLKKVSQRRKFMKYLQTHDPKGYEKIIKKIKR